MIARRLISALGSTVAMALLVPAAAAASTWTVDDDGVQCPNAGFTTIQAAINQAAPWDTIAICDGDYAEVSNATSAANSPAQAGAKNGLTITKPLTIRGAGADKVTIRPAASAAPSLAGTAPFLRDGGGAVVQINRQAGGSSDVTENFVDISGVTITSPTIYAEAGIAFFNTSGRISSSVIGPLRRAADGAELAAMPHGWGVIMTDSIQGAGEAAVRRELSIVDSLLTGYQSGGILFDAARGTDGNATNTVRSGIREYGWVTGTRVVGSGTDALIPQTGIRWHAGARGSVTGSEIAGNSFGPDRRRSVGILLTDAETGLDPSNPTVRAFRASGNAITGNGYGFFNADILNASVRLGASASAPGNWWGCATGPPASGCNSVSGVDTASAPSVELGTPLASAPPPLAVPAPTPDLPPAGSFVDPAEGDEVAIGETVTPTVFTSDDFGVNSVAVTLDGNPFATGGHTPYEFSWTPTIADIGTRTFAATITDSSGHTTVVSRRLVVPAPPGYVAATLDPLSWNAGTILIGFATTRSFTLTNTGQNPVAIGSIALTGDATFAISGGSCAAPSTLAIGASCTIVVRFAPAGEGPRVGALSVGYVAPGSTGPLVATLTGSGHIVPVLAIPGAGPGAAVPPPAAPMCEGHTATIVAAPGQTSIIGTPGSDVIIGTAAADTIDGRGGNDTICAGAGADTVRGARGNDLIRGGSGNDRLSGDAGDDVLLGGAGADDLRGGSGNDRTGGGDGNDRVDGGSGNDVLDEMKLSGRGKDRLFGGTGNDRIRTAGSTKDQVDCGSGRDFVLVDRFDKHVRCESVTHA